MWPCAFRTHTSVYIHTCTQAYICACTLMYICSHTHMHTWVNAQHTQAHVCIFSHTHIHTSQHMYNTLKHVMYSVTHAMHHTGVCGSNRCDAHKHNVQRPMPDTGHIYTDPCIHRYKDTHKIQACAVHTHVVHTDTH